MRSPHAHPRVLSIDTVGALAGEGVDDVDTPVTPVQIWRRLNSR